jgi:hypothetical protein
MEKSYKILSHTEEIPVEEIRELYKGYWIYIVKARFTETGSLISGLPVIAGKASYDGVEDGIYDKFKAEIYAERTGFNLLENTGFISALAFAGEVGLHGKVV